MLNGSFAYLSGSSDPAAPSAAANLLVCQVLRVTTNCRASIASYFLTTALSLGGAAVLPATYFEAVPFVLSAVSPVSVRTKRIHAVHALFFDVLENSMRKRREKKVNWWIILSSQCQCLKAKVYILITFTSVTFFLRFNYLVIYLVT